MIKLVFLYIVVLLFIIITILIFSKVQLKIENFKFTSETIRHINTDYKFVIKLYIFSKIPILKISITKKFLERLKLKEKMKTFEMDFIENKFSSYLIIFIQKNITNATLQSIKNHLLFYQFFFYCHF